MEENSGIFINLPQAATLDLPDPDLRQYYIDLENRSIWLDTEIDESCRAITKFILECNRYDKDVEPDKRKPIKLFIASPGGALDVADGVISMIKLSETPIWGIAMECVASAASLVFLACHKRLAMPNAVFIFHKGSAAMSGDYETMMKAVEDYQKTVEKMVNFYVEKTNISEDVIREKIKQDWYLYASDDDIIKNGVVDEIITNISSLL